MDNDRWDHGQEVAAPGYMRVSFDEADAAKALSDYLDRILFPIGDRRIAVVCVGTDRSTGDAFGPIVGSKLKALHHSLVAEIYGTLDEPVHAVNLADTLHDIYDSDRDRPFIIAIDACLGKFDHVGQITIEPGPLRPGAGVKKSLPTFGDYTLTGVVNVSGFMEYFVLQNTRLGIVMRMTDVVVAAFQSSIQRLNIRRSVIADKAYTASRP